MNEDCEYFRILLYLHRDGELSAEERQRLTDHTGRCDECRNIHEEIARVDGPLLTTLRQKSPEHPDPEALTNKIVRSVKAEAGVGEQPVRWTDRFGEWLNLPSVRWGMVGATFCILGLIILQEVLIFKSLQRLEARILLESSAVQDGSDRYYDRLLTQILEELTEDDVIPGAGTGEELQVLYKDYKRLTDENILLKLLLRERFPEIYTALQGEKLSPESLKALLREQQDLLQLRRQL